MSEIDFAKIVAEDAAANSGKTPAPAEQAEQVDDTAEATTAPADEAAEEQPNEAAGDEPKQPKKPGGGFQKRISELTREKHEALRREQETRELLAKTTAALEAVSGGRKPAATAQSDEPRPEQFDRYEDYVRAAARWDAKQSVREELKGFQKKQGEQTREQAAQASYEALEAKVLKQAQADPEIGEAFEAAKESPTITPTIAEYLREASDEPGLLIKYLMNNEDEANRISRLGDIAAVKELAKVEARLSAKPKPKTSSAPPPPTTVGGGAAAQQSIERMPYSGVMEWVRQQDAKR
jgi:hypothetical protein